MKFTLYWPRLLKYPALGMPLANSLKRTKSRTERRASRGTHQGILGELRMAKKSRRGGESQSGYFRRIFDEHPEWLFEKSNSAVLDRYRASAATACYPNTRTGLIDYHDN